MQQSFTNPISDEWNGWNVRNPISDEWNGWDVWNPVNNKTDATTLNIENLQISTTASAEDNANSCLQNQETTINIYSYDKKAFTYTTSQFFRYFPDCYFAIASRWLKPIDNIIEVVTPLTQQGIKALEYYFIHEVWPNQQIISADTPTLEFYNDDSSFNEIVDFLGLSHAEDERLSVEDTYKDLDLDEQRIVDRIRKQEREEALIQQELEQQEKQQDIEYRFFCDGYYD